MKHFLAYHIWLSCIISLFIFAIVFLMSPLFASLNFWIYENIVKLRYSLGMFQQSQQVIVVEIDEKSFDDIWTFPFPRSLYGEALENIFFYDPAVVAFDILFLDPSQKDQDVLFLQSLKKYPGRVVLGSARNQDGDILEPYAYFSTLPNGYLTPSVERSTNTVYSFSPQFQDKEVYEHFTLAILRSFFSYMYLEDSSQELWEYHQDEYVFSPERRFSLKRPGDKNILISYAPSKSYTRISFSDLLNTQKLKELSDTIGFQNSIILIWPAANGLKDEFFTPFGKEYGVYVHANILSTLLSENILRYFPKILEWSFIVILVFLSILIHLSFSYRVIIVSHALMLSFGMIILPLLSVLLLWELWQYTIELFFTLILSFALAQGLKYAIESLHKNKLNTALSQYVSSSIADEIIAEKGHVKLDGERRNLLCYFSDLEGFTSMSERLSPEVLVAFLRDYLSCMTESIMSRWWHIDKYEGDAIMAIWGAFEELQHRHFSQVLLSILEQRKILQDIHTRWGRKLGWNIRFRVGLHSGDAIIGNIGAVWKKMDFTALWDTVNLASRLEWVNKYYGTYICVSHTVYEKTKDDFAFRFIDTIRVKWKDTPVQIYEFLGKKEDVDMRKYEDYFSGLDAYQKRDFEEARWYFWKYVTDTVSQVYKNRCGAYMQTPPPKDWDGVWTMEEK